MIRSGYIMLHVCTLVLALQAGVIFGELSEPEDVVGVRDHEGTCEKDGCSKVQQNIEKDDDEVKV